METSQGATGPVRPPGWRKQPTRAVRLVALPPAAMRALADGQVEAASELAGERLSEFLAGEECAWLWRLRLEQLQWVPEAAEWVARAAVSEPDGVVVGHAGFHGPPDDTGMVEIGYTVDPAHRRRGYATAMVDALLRWAASDPRVRVVRATISPDNAASLATIAGFGFVQVGEQWDDEDGLELVFEHVVHRDS